MKRAYFKTFKVARRFASKVGLLGYVFDIRPMTASKDVECAVGYIVEWWP